jgi:hypothetical protein
MDIGIMDDIGITDDESNVDAVCAPFRLQFIRQPFSPFLKENIIVYIPDTIHI